MDPSIVVSLGIFVALVVLFVVVARRTAQVVVETREAQVFRRVVADLAARLDISLGGLIERIDGVRRHALAPDAIGESLAAGSEALDRYAEEARGLRHPPSAAELADGLVGEIERAGRAVRMVEHGCTILAAARGVGGEAEGEVAIKRGYLNLLHAREAIAEYAAEIALARPGSNPRWYSRREREAAASDPVRRDEPRI
jgi:hypothetical protein